MSGDPYFNRAQAKRALDTAALGPIRISSSPTTVKLRAIVYRGHVDREIDPASIDVIVVGATRFIKEGQS